MGWIVELLLLKDYVIVDLVLHLLVFRNLQLNSVHFMASQFFMI